MLVEVRDELREEMDGNPNGNSSAELYDVSIESSIQNSFIDANDTVVNSTVVNNSTGMSSDSDSTMWRYSGIDYR